MPLPSLPPQPLLSDLTNRDATGGWTGMINRVWSQWFNSVVNRVQQTPLILTIQYNKNITAALSGQVLLAASMNTQQALYRITYHNDLNTAGGKCTISVTYVCDGVSRTVTGVQVTSVADPVCGVFLIDPDVNTAITYATTCVIPGGGISYNLEVILERMS